MARAKKPFRKFYPRELFTKGGRPPLPPEVKTQRTIDRLERQLAELRKSQPDSMSAADAKPGTQPTSAAVPSRLRQKVSS
jgi:hypothetical protein